MSTNKPDPVGIFTPTVVDPSDPNAISPVQPTSPGFFPKQAVDGEFFPDGKGTTTGDAGTPFVAMDSSSIKMMRTAAAEITQQFASASSHPSRSIAAAPKPTHSAFDGMA